MKIIEYKFLSCEVNRGTDETPVMEPVFLDKEIWCKTQTQYDVGYAIAENEAVGEILVEGDFEVEEPSQEERIAELEEALAMLLNGVTE